jgi:ferric-dicitrate binding protein FerR (iron transport regulator)
VSDYLWDKSGEDADVERLEQALAPMRYRGRPPRLPRRLPFVRAAMALAAAAIALILWRPWAPALYSLDGEWVVANGRWTLEVAGMGTVTLLPGTRARPGKGTVELDHGTLLAKISAPPRRFSVVTKYAVIFDLGCAFEVAADENGVRVKVTEGSVAVAQDGRENVLAAGAEATLPAKKAAVIAPKTEAPKTEAPKAEAPKTETPKAKTEAPKLKVMTPKPVTNHAAPQKKEAPKQPAKKDDGLHLQHDSLKDLEHGL